MFLPGEDCSKPSLGYDDVVTVNDEKWPVQTIAIRRLSRRFRSKQVQLYSKNASKMLFDPVYDNQSANSPSITTSNVNRASFRVPWTRYIHPSRSWVCSARSLQRSPWSYHYSLDDPLKLSGRKRLDDANLRLWTWCAHLRPHCLRQQHGLLEPRHPDSSDAWRYLRFCESVQYWKYLWLFSNEIVGRAPQQLQSLR